MVYSAQFPISLPDSNTPLQLDLFIPQSRYPEVLQLGPDSAIAGLLAKARLTRVAESVETLLCRQAVAGTDAGNDAGDAPALAAIAYCGEDWAGGRPAFDSGCVLFADPVHLQLQRDCFTLSAPVPLPLSVEETSALLDALNEHFAEDGLRFAAGSSGHWYLHMAQMQAMTTQPPDRAMDRDIHAFQPTGPDAARWQHLSNEIQMLLHAHPVNQQREARGLPACNSLWFWGGGELPQVKGRSAVFVYGCSPLVKGLGRLGHVTHKGAAPVAADMQGHSTICWWLDGTSTVDSGLQLAADALRRGKLCHLRLHLADRGEVLRADLRRVDLFKFWRRRRAVHTCFAERA